FIVLLLTTSLGASRSFGSGASWVGPDNNYPINWNFAPQTEINSSNVGSLQVQWTFPVPSAPPPYAGAEGVMVTPLVIEGIAYVVTNWHRVFALDANDGKVLWFKDLPINSTYLANIPPSVFSGLGSNTGTPGHYHSILYTTAIFNEPLIWIITNSYQIFALTALTGDVVENFSPLDLNLTRAIAGDFGGYDQDTPSILVDQQRGILLFSPSVSEGDSSGRGMFEGWNVTSKVPAMLWRTFMIPPQDGTNPNWSLESVENMTHAYIFNGKSAIDLKALPQSELQSVLKGDWGDFGFNGSISLAGGGGGWGGSWAIDESTGTAYLGTSTAAPDWNATNRPGPDLWTNSILALNETNGKINWAFQAIPHSLGDFDCSWNVLLANVTINNHNTEAVFKGCKGGYLFALNAHTGAMLWYLKPPSIKWDSVIPLDPLNSTQMSGYNWYGYPSKSPVLQNPGDTGSLESDIAYDPTSNTIFLAPYNDPKLFTIADVSPPKNGSFNSAQWEFTWGTNITGITPAGQINTTILAVDANTGNVKWSYFIPDQAYRGGLTVSGGVLYVSTYDGILRMLNSKTGQLITEKLIGGSLLIQPSIAQDSNLKMELFLTDMGSARWGPVFPGFVQALGIDANASDSMQQSGNVSGSLFYTIIFLTIVLAISTTILLFLKLKLRR
ncbi:MAG: PQQ-binding-like beta-propeller repeat protein, partial [Nitrososphaerales archaeon]